MMRTRLPKIVLVLVLEIASKAYVAFLPSTSAKSLSRGAPLACQDAQIRGGLLEMRVRRELQATPLQNSRTQGSDTKKKLFKVAKSSETSPCLSASGLLKRRK
jgi:hypothetical protein